MQTRKIKFTFLIIIVNIFSFLLCSCDVASLSGLDDLTNPHLGVYHCEQLLLGEKDILQKYDSLTLELKMHNEYIFTAVPNSGLPIKKKGTYSFDRNNNVFTINEKIFAKSLSASFVVEDGEIMITKVYAGKPFIAKFKLK